MSLDLLQDPARHLVEVKVSGKLKEPDYQAFAPKIDDFIKHNGKVRILFDMRDFHGWTLFGALEDLRFGVKHRKDVERVALVGEKSWQKWSTPLCRLFTRADVHYFDRGHEADAHEWVVA
jgi:hypothetical protein